MAEYNFATRQKFLRLQPEDLVRIAAIRDRVQRHADEHVAAFFDCLANLSEAATLFRRRDLLEQAKRLKRQHILAMVEGDYGSKYVEQRVALGALYGQVALDTRT